MFCPAPESAFHRNAMLKTDINSSMSVSFLSRLDYSAPPQAYPVEPFRLCDFNEQSALQWVDYNFGFSGKNIVFKFLIFRSIQCLNVSRRSLFFIPHAKWKIQEVILLPRRIWHIHLCEWLPCTGTDNVHRWEV